MARVSSSFAGALGKAMRMANPPVMLEDLVLISDPLSEEDVMDLLLARRLPTDEEVVVLADVFGLTLDGLLEHQRVTRQGASSTAGGVCGADGSTVPMKLRVTPDVRTALRLRKATTGRDINDLILEILGDALAEELVVVHGHTNAG
jgi:hypothetical protein